MPSRLVPVGGGGLAPPPLTQSGKGAALDDMAPLDLIAAFFLRGAMSGGQEATPMLRRIRSHCAEAAERAHIGLNEDAVDAFLDTLDESEFSALKTQHGLRFPLRFSSFMDQLNFVAVLAMLNAFSGYRAAFHQATGHGAFDCIRKIVLGMYLSADEGDSALDTLALERVTPSTLAQLLGVPTHSETPHPSLPGVVVGTIGGPLREPFEMAAKMCVETAAFLKARQHKNLASYVWEVCEQASRHEHVESCIVEGLAEVPAFYDALDSPYPIPIMKKALFLVRALQGLVLDAEPHTLPRLMQILSERWRHGLGEPLPMFVDNVIPTMLIYLGMLQLEHSSILSTWHPAPQDSDTSGPLVNRSDAYHVRAAALVAGARIVERARTSSTWISSITEEQLDAYLWSMAKRPEFRCISRLAEQHTGMY